jgi:hypothetical protein
VSAVHGSATILILGDNTLAAWSVKLLLASGSKRRDQTPTPADGAAERIFSNEKRSNNHERSEFIADLAQEVFAPENP